MAKTRLEGRRKLLIKHYCSLKRSLHTLHNSSWLWHYRRRRYTVTQTRRCNETRWWRNSQRCKSILVPPEEARKVEGRVCALPSLPVKTMVAAPLSTSAVSEEIREGATGCNCLAVMAGRHGLTEKETTSSSLKLAPYVALPRSEPATTISGFED